MNAKGDLIARLLNLGLGAPSFECVSSGPAHERVFHATVTAGGHVLGAGGQARSKKDAERLAAESALHALHALESGQTLSGAQPRPGEAPDGVWPIYSGVLEGALEAALDLAGDEATVDDVRRDAARLYRDLLLDLGHGPE